MKTVFNKLCFYLFITEVALASGAALACAQGNLKIIQDREGNDLAVINFQDNSVTLVADGYWIGEIGFQEKYLESTPVDLCISPKCPMEKGQIFDLASQGITLQNSKGGLIILMINMNPIGHQPGSYFLGNFAPAPNGCAELIRPDGF